MAKADHARALDILRYADRPMDVTLASGTTLRVWNIGWGYDRGEEVAYVTADSTPAPGEEEPGYELFYSSEIAAITDPENGAIWFETDNAEEWRPE